MIFQCILQTSIKMCLQWYTSLRAASGQDQGAAQAVEGLYDGFCRSARSAAPAGAYPQVLPVLPAGAGTQVTTQGS